MKKVLTLCIPIKGNEVLFGMKKRGFGAGHWNGFGGKLETGETVEQALFRELQEEVGLVATTAEKMGILYFTFQADSLELEVHIFTITDFVGEPVETEEMRPQWFSIDAIPYTEMWPDDEYWFPLLLAGKRFKGTFLLDQPSSLDYSAKIVSQELHEVEVL